jgi:hypothetical protein
LKLPRSPTWRSSSVGAPWVLLWGLTGGVSEGRSVHIHVVCDIGSWRIGREWGSGRGAKGAGREEHTMRSSAGAAIGVVTERVDMDTTLSIWVVARDVEGDGRGLVLGALLEGDGALDVRVSSDDGDCCPSLLACTPVVSVAIPIERLEDGGMIEGRSRGASRSHQGSTPSPHPHPHPSALGPSRLSRCHHIYPGAIRVLIYHLSTQLRARLAPKVW